MLPPLGHPWMQLSANNSNQLVRSSEITHTADTNTDSSCGPKLIGSLSSTFMFPWTCPRPLIISTQIAQVSAWVSYSTHVVIPYSSTPPQRSNLPFTFSSLLGFESKVAAATGEVTAFITLGASSCTFLQSLTNPELLQFHLIPVTTLPWSIPFFLTSGLKPWWNTPMHVLSLSKLKEVCWL